MSELILGIDTHGEALSVGLISLDRMTGETVVLGERSLWRENPREDIALRFVADLLNETQVAPSQLSLLAVTRGPGGFTSVRVGMSVALGLSLGAKLPVWPVISLEALAMNLKGKAAHVMPLLDARKGEVYGALYRFEGAQPVQMLAPQVSTCEAMRALATELLGPEVDLSAVSLGSGALAYGATSLADEAAHLVSGVKVAELAASQWRAANFDTSSAPALDAVYLRRPEAEVAKLAELIN